MTQAVELKHLHARDDNANVMSDEFFAKLTGHIQRTGHYPPIIVRPHPTIDGDYEILDGHHRVRALAAIEQAIARIEVWDVDDDEALMLLATLNRLEGRDDPAKRGNILHTLAERFGRDRLPSLLPEDDAKIERLLSLRLPPTPPAPPPSPDALPEAVTFFLTRPQKKALGERLSVHEGTRTERLIQLLHLEPSA